MALMQRDHRIGFVSAPVKSGGCAAARTSVASCPWEFARLHSAAHRSFETADAGLSRRWRSPLDV